MPELFRRPVGRQALAREAGDARLVEAVDVGPELEPAVAVDGGGAVVEEDRDRRVELEPARAGDRQAASSLAASQPCRPSSASASPAGFSSRMQPWLSVRSLRLNRPRFGVSWM
jgi:hypothetical protein